MADLTTSLALLNGRKEAFLAIRGHLNSLSSTLEANLSANAQEIATAVSALQGIAGVRQTSSVDDYCLNERTIGQGAAIDFIKANPECSEEEALSAWLEAVTAAIPVVTHDPKGLLKLYVGNMAGQMATPGDTAWEAFRAFVGMTDKSKLMGM